MNSEKTRKSEVFLLYTSFAVSAKLAFISHFAARAGLFGFTERFFR